MTDPIVAEAFGHHLWATRRILDACLPLTDEQLATNVPGTFGTILDTRRHVVGGDPSYLSVVTYGRFLEIDDATMSVRDLSDALPAIEAGWARLLADEPDGDAQVMRKRDDGSASFAPMSVR